MKLNVAYTQLLWLARCVMVICGLSLNACTDSVANAPANSPPPPNVTIAKAHRQVISRWDEYTGRIEAVNSVALRARVNGYLEKIHFTAGDVVNKGDVLFSIDSRPYKAQLNLANAELEKAKSKRDLARNDLTRAENLFKESAVSAEELDLRTHLFHEAIASVESAQANVTLAKLNVDYCTLTAPFHGRISEQTLDEGNLVSSDSVLAQLVSTQPMYVYADVDEAALLNYRRSGQQKAQTTSLKGLPLTLMLTGDDKTQRQGKLDYVSPRENTSTSTVTVRGVFDNADGLLMAGLFARLRLQASEPVSALLLPDKAIGQDQTVHFVWVVNEAGEVSYRKVQIGFIHEGLRVIEQGLSDDDWVVIDGLQKVRPNSKVNAQRIELSTSRNAT